MIRLNCFIQVSAENRAELLAISKELVAKSLNDNGCIAYDIFESATRPEVMMICETWKDAACLDVHMHAPHFTELVPKIQALGAMKIEQFEF
ncbi:MAG: putative quinol monooxygenase [Prevotella sp.]|nr:antibiotic biosynthesis monooxygenase [Parabacteroides distasonis]MDD5820992.1 putative quinol monooxygenase [Prevotella sp.]